MKPQVGDLLCGDFDGKGEEFPNELWLLVKVGDLRTREPYHLLCPKGKIVSFPRKYIENDCEVVSASR